MVDGVPQGQLRFYYKQFLLLDFDIYSVHVRFVLIHP